MSLLKQDFEWLHAHPELSYEEYETTNYVRNRLTEAGVEILSYPLETGLVAQVQGKAEGPVVALRADMDALLVQEESGVAYASCNAGKMHACGHDFHTAVLLDTARKLQAKKDALAGTVRLIFQPGEERSDGALKILATPAMQDVQAVFALHTAPWFPVGTIGVRNGAASASVDRFEITVTGQGCHAASPEKGVDPIVAAAAIVSAAQTVVSRNVSPVHPALVSITHFEAGTTWNVIPESAYLEGTVRTHFAADREMIPQRLEAIAKGVAAGYGTTATFTWHAGPPATDNDPEWTAFAAEVAQKQGITVEEDPANMLGEDFSWFQQKAPGVYIHVGVGLTKPLHNPGFTVDEASLEPAAAYSAALAQAALEKLAK